MSGRGTVLSAAPGRPMRVAGREHQLQVAFRRLPGFSVQWEIPADVSVHHGGDLAGQVVAASGSQAVPPVQEVAYQRLVLAREPLRLGTMAGEGRRLWQASGALHVARRRRAAGGG